MKVVKDGTVKGMLYKVDLGQIQLDRMLLCKHVKHNQSQASHPISIYS